MDWLFILDMLGGLALFLYGMNMLGTGLEQTSGGRLEKMLEKMSGSPLRAVLLGALVTAAVQSSSATTVIVVGLVNANILKLKQAIGVIMGANIGTTVTAHILRLASVDSNSFWLTLLKPNSWTPILLVLGVILLMGNKKGSRKELGQIFLGFGILFVGMFTMSDAVAPLGESPVFMQMFSMLSNPVAGVLAGALVTAVIQSSSASVGILQALASTGAITCSAAFPIIMGQNIGTCITPILASIGASKNAKRSAFVHLTFNIAGTLIFLIATYLYQSTIGFSFWDMPIDGGGIANFHTVFNLTVTLLLLPFVGLLEKLALACIKEGKAGEDESHELLAHLDPRFLVSHGLALEHVKQAVYGIGALMEKNYFRVLALFQEYDIHREAKLLETETVINEVDTKVNAYLLELAGYELNETENQQITYLLQVCREMERLGDYVIHVMECAKDLHSRGTAFSEAGMTELEIMGSAIAEILHRALQAFQLDDEELAKSIEPLEEVINQMEDAMKSQHMERLRRGACTMEAGYAFVDCISNLERMANHCSNIGMDVIDQQRGGTLNKHQYTRELQINPTKEYKELYDDYMKRYYRRLVLE